MELSSPRLLFIPFIENDFANYLLLVTNEKVMALITGRALTEIEAMERFLRNLDTNREHPVIGWYTVHSKENKEFIGLGKLVMTAQHEAEIGYSLLPEHWGKGYAGEISETLILHARTIPGIHSLMAIIDPENEASRKILKKGNFSLDQVCELEGLPAEIYKLELF